MALVGWPVEKAVFGSASSAAAVTALPVVTSEQPRERGRRETDTGSGGSLATVGVCSWTFPCSRRAAVPSLFSAMPGVSWCRAIISLGQCADALVGALPGRANTGAGHAKPGNRRRLAARPTASPDRSAQVSMARKRADAEAQREFACASCHRASARCVVDGLASLLTAGATGLYSPTHAYLFPAGMRGLGVQVPPRTHIFRIGAHLECACADTTSSWHGRLDVPRWKSDPNWGFLSFRSAPRLSAGSVTIRLRRLLVAVKFLFGMIEPGGGGRQAGVRPGRGGAGITPRARGSSLG